METYHQVEFILWLNKTIYEILCSYFRMIIFFYFNQPSSIIELTKQPIEIIFIFNVN